MLRLHVRLESVGYHAVVQHGVVKEVVKPDVFHRRVEVQTGILKSHIETGEHRVGLRVEFQVLIVPQAVPS